MLNHYLAHLALHDNNGNILKNGKVVKPIQNIWVPNLS